MEHTRWCLQDKASGKGNLGCKNWPLDKHVDFDHQHAWEKTAPLAAPALKAKDVKYNAKVVFSYALGMQFLLCFVKRA